MSDLFKNLGLFGIPECDETAILAAMTVGEPLLFVGEPGTAKTEIIKMLGMAMGEHAKKLNATTDVKNYEFNYHVYDCSKLNFEDLIGYPNIEALKQNRIEFIPSKTTIWDKDLVGLDEINRCEKDRQNNLFELLRGRTCMGVPTRAMFLFSAMNPYDNSSTTELLDALVDRHLFYIRAVPFNEMSPEDRKSVINRVGEADCKGLRYWSKTKYQFDTSTDTYNDHLAEQGKKIREILSQAIGIYEELSRGLSNTVTSLMDSLVQKMYLEAGKSKDYIPKISGRRAGMVSRAIYAYRAVEVAKSKVLGTPLQSIEKTANTVIRLALPLNFDTKINVNNVTRITTIIDEVVSMWAKNIDESSRLNDAAYELYYTGDPIRKLEILITEDIGKLAKTQAWASLVNSDPAIASLVYILRSTTKDTVPDYVISDQEIAKCREFLEKTDKQIIPTPHLMEHIELVNRIYNGSDKHYILKLACAISLHLINEQAKDEEDAYRRLKRLAKLQKTWEDRLTTGETKPEEAPAEETKKSKKK